MRVKDVAEEKRLGVQIRHLSESYRGIVIKEFRSRQQKRDPSSKSRSGKSIAECAKWLNSEGKRSDLLESISSTTKMMGHFTLNDLRKDSVTPKILNRFYGNLTSLL